MEGSKQTERREGDVQIRCERALQAGHDMKKCTSAFVSLKTAETNLIRKSNPELIIKESSTKLKIISIKRLLINVFIFKILA